MTEAPSRPPRPGLAQLLIDNKLISEAQADLAAIDQEITGMSFDEVVLLRGWVDRETLIKIAPWLNAPANAASQAESQQIMELGTSIGTHYQENLKVYRRLMEKILGKGWD
jgi:hypothetical protein